MEALVCEKCGATKLKIENGFMVCEYCDTKFIKPENLKIKKDTCISLADDIARLIEKCKNEPQNAKRYANRVLDIDPGNQEVLKYL